MNKINIIVKLHTVKHSEIKKKRMLSLALIVRM